VLGHQKRMSMVGAMDTRYTEGDATGGAQRFPVDVGITRE